MIIEKILKRPDVGIILAYSKPRSADDLVLRFGTEKLTSDRIELSLDDREDLATLAILQEFPELEFGVESRPRPTNFPAGTTIKVAVETPIPVGWARVGTDISSGLITLRKV
jgi:hypothetical protein